MSFLISSTEELVSEKIRDISFLGIVNDDSQATGAIGKVHLGLVFVVDVGGRLEIKEKNKFKGGEFVMLKDLKSKLGEMESWSRLVTVHLLQSPRGMMNK